MDQGDDGISEAPRKRGIVDRLRGLFRREDSSALLVVPEIPEAEVWARERARRRQADPNRLSDG